MKKKVSLHTQAELDQLRLLMNTGDPYRNLNISKESCTPREIEISYKNMMRKEKIASKTGVNTKEKENKHKRAFLVLENAYKLLTNTRMKELYDHYYYDEMKKQNIDKKKKHGSSNYDQTSLASSGSGTVGVVSSLFNNGLFKRIYNNYYLFINHPLKTSTFLIRSGSSSTWGSVLNKSSGIYSTLKLLPTLNDGETYFRMLYRGITATYSLILVDGMRSFLLGEIANGIFGLQPSSVIGRILRTTSKSLVTLPLIFIVDVFKLSPYKYSFWYVLENVILKRSKSGDIGITSGYQFSNLYYSFISAISVIVAKKLIRNGYQFIKSTINEKHESNPDNQVYYHLNNILSNYWFAGITKAILYSPFEVTYSKYPKLIVDSYMGNQPIPTFINPISMAIQIYNQNHNIYNFFSGLTPCIISNIMFEYMQKDYKRYDYFEIFE